MNLVTLYSRTDHRIEVVVFRVRSNRAHAVP
jgi:hypothetical protein